MLLLLLIVYNCLIIIILLTKVKVMEVAIVLFQINAGVLVVLIIVGEEHHWLNMGINLVAPLNVIALAGCRWCCSYWRRYGIRLR